MVRFALVGAGFIGGGHAANLAAHPQGDFALVDDVDGDPAQTVAHQFDSHATESVDDVFASDVDAVLIASSTDTHAVHLARAASAGIAALCEKPIDLDLGRAVEVVHTTHGHGIVAMVDFNRRF